MVLELDSWTIGGRVPVLEENPCPWTRISLYLTGYTKGNYD